MSRPALVLPAIVLGVALLPATSSAAPTSRTVTSGAVSATVTATGDAEQPGVRLVVTRAGATLFDGRPGVPDPDPDSIACGNDDSRCTVILGPQREDALIVRDINGDGEPEVIVDQYTGGAHCCSEATVLFLDAAGTGYGQWSRNFGDSGYRLVTRGSNVLFRTGDERFNALYASHADSAVPIELLRWTGGDQWRLVTGDHRADVRQDLRVQRRTLDRALRTRGADRRGVAAAWAAWAADAYRLGQRRSALRQLRRWAAAGRMGGFAGPRGARFVRDLDRRLLKWEYRP